jgi:hypothetical protein
MKARTILALLVLGPLAACGRSPVRLETRTYALHYLSRGEAQDIVGPYIYGDRPGAQGAMSASQNTLTVRETPDNLDRIARVLSQFDRPAPSVRLTFKLIRADGAARRDSSIRDVESALRSLFRFEGYALISEAVVTGAQASRIRQTLGGSGGPYSLETFIERVGNGGDSAVVSLDVHLMFRGGEFRTSVGVPVGKTAVLGNVEGESHTSALILTVRPEIVSN